MCILRKTRVCRNIFFNKAAGLRPTALLEKRLWHRYFPKNFAKFLRTAFLKKTSNCCFSGVCFTFFTNEALVVKGDIVRCFIILAIYWSCQVVAQ